MQDRDMITVERTRSTPNILLHGSWGPQKNIELGMATLYKIRRDGISFNLIITGGINNHFPEYEEHFRNILDQYNFANCYKGSVSEKEIFNLFTNSNLLLLPYNTPGGHSAVLEQAMFFEIPTVAIDFQEYREQAKGIKNITLVKPENFPKAVRDCLLNYSSNTSSTLDISIKRKLDFTLKNIKMMVSSDL
jgi:hypothetical protein